MLSNVIENTQTLTGHATSLVSTVGKIFTEGYEPTMLRQNVMNKEILEEAMDFIFCGPEQTKNSSQSAPMPNSCPENSLTSRFTLAAAILLQNQFYGHAGVRQIWESLLLRIEKCFDDSSYLPDTGLSKNETIDNFNEQYSTKKINWKECLLHQKLCMINICIAAKRRREFILTESLWVDEEEIETPEPVETEPVEINEKSASRKVSVATNSDSDDFYDCEDEQEQEEATNEQSESQEFKTPQVEQTEPKADPKVANPPKKIPRSYKFIRKNQAKNSETGQLLFLLNNKSTPIYEPFTQIHKQQTSDELDKMTQIISEEIENQKTAEDKSTEQFKAQQMNKDLLKSDIQSFKAANPEGVFEDFVRWHSPRDFYEDENGSGTETGVTGRLSERFNEDSDWTKIWNSSSANPCPAYKQTRIFDETNSYLNLLEELKNYTLKDLFSSIQGSLSSQIVNYMNLPYLDNGYDLENDLLASVKEKEIFESLKMSLKKKFGDCCPQTDGCDSENETLTKLSQKEIIKPIGGSHSKIGKRLLYFLSKSSYTNNHNQNEALPPEYHKNLELPISREFLLFVKAKYPSAMKSRSFLQKLYMRQDAREFRLAGSFTSDDTFL